MITDISAFETTCQLVWAYAGKIPVSGIGSYYYLTHHFAWMMLQGSGKLSFESGVQVNMEPGKWYLPSPLLARGQCFSADTRIISIRFLFEAPGGMSPLLLPDCVSFDAAEFSSLTHNAKKLVRLTRSYLDGPLHTGEASKMFLERKIKTEAVFLTWLSLLLKVLKRKGIQVSSPENFDPRLQKMVNYLNKITTYSSVPYSQLSSLSSLGRIQIDRIFKEKTGLSPQQFMFRNLLAICKERIVFSNLVLKELSDELGFSSTSRFCAWFRHNTGMTPGGFRKKELSNLLMGAPIT
jgi:AraC-like DNA-binding protein